MLAMTHLADEAMQHGCLDVISAFPFEEFYYKLKRWLRKLGATLQQVVNRTYDSRALTLPQAKATTRFIRPHEDGPLPLNYTHCQQSKSVVTPLCRFGTSDRDC